MEKHGVLLYIIIVPNKCSFLCLPSSPLKRGPACISLFLMSWYTMEILSCTVALFCIHHGGNRNWWCPKWGENRQGFPSGFSFLFRRKLGPTPRNESPGAGVFHHLWPPHLGPPSFEVVCVWSRGSCLVYWGWH